MRTRIAVVIMAALLALYLVFAVRYGQILIGVRQPVPVAIGVALLVLPVVGAVTFTTLVGIWLTSSLWFFNHVGTGL